jgi:hypothetical protein
LDLIMILSDNSYNRNFLRGAIHPHDRPRRGTPEMVKQARLTTAAGNAIGDKS